MKRPILVTGAHRSGTTWIAKMLALAPGVGYIHEPFSPFTSPGVSGAPFDRFFAVVTAENEAAYLPHLERTLRFQYSVRRQLPTVRGPRDAIRSAQDAIAQHEVRLIRQWRLGRNAWIASYRHVDSLGQGWDASQQHSAFP